jgi:serine/threonine protein kinase HipA of HipAB toxin-antitoxin module
MRLLAPFRACVAGGGVLTFIGDEPNQVIYWSIEGFDPETEDSCPPVGSLRWQYNRTDKSSRATNIYLAPKINPGAVYDRVTAKVVE